MPTSLDFTVSQVIEAVALDPLQRSTDESGYGRHWGRYCARHRLEQMVDVLDRHCAQQGCDRQPIYGQAGEKEGRPMWCPDHRPAGSFDVKTSRCQEPGCLKHPR